MLHDLKDERVGILITTFMREELCLQCINAVRENWKSNYFLMIANQGLYSELLEKKLRHIVACGQGELFDLPFDCGLSFARNYLVDKCVDYGIKFVLLETFRSC